MSAQHTPGPWFALPRKYSTIYVEARIGGGMLQEVAACGPTEVTTQAEANARLIAAAPETAKERDELKAINAELLAALKWSVNAFDLDTIEEIEAGYGEGTAKQISAARAVIAKATGDAA